MMIYKGEATDLSDMTEEEAWAEVERIAPSNEEFLALVARFPPPQEWYDEDCWDETPEK